MRTATIILVALSAAFLAACGDDGADPQFPEDLRGKPTNRFKDEPNTLRVNTLTDPWVSTVRVWDGKSTFGKEVPRIVRLEIDGRGPLTRREVSLQTPASVALFQGAGEQRMQRLVQGSLSELERRHGFIRGINLSSTPANYQAGAIADTIEELAIDGVVTKSDRDLVEFILNLLTVELAAHSGAYFDPRTTWVSLGPDVSKTIRLHATRPKQVKPADGIFAAHVVLHEFEHAVTPPNGDDPRPQWVEEGGADVLARWPGASARMAREMGLPYPKRFDEVAYKPKGGYPDWSESFFLLLEAAGIDTSDPKQRNAAAALVQRHDDGRETLIAIYRAITIEQGLSAARAKRLRRDIVALDGDPKRTRRVVAAWI